MHDELDDDMKTLFDFFITKGFDPEDIRDSLRHFIHNYYKSENYLEELHGQNSTD